MTLDDTSVVRILTGTGEAAYRWTMDDDRIAWSEGAAVLLGHGRHEVIATGRSYAALIESHSEGTRYDAVHASGAKDVGTGVAYQIQYAIRAPHDGESPLWVEDIGRWYADERGRPARAEGVVRIVNERHAREERLAFLSRYDEDTGLFNRAHLLDRLDETIALSVKQRSHAAFLVAGFDNLKLIKEAYGLTAADRALVAIAERIRGRLRDGDAIGRFTPHKLGLLLHNCGEHEMAVAAQRFIDAVDHDVIATSDGTIAVTISIGGVAIPRHARSRLEVVERTYEALETARAGGPGRFTMFKPSKVRTAERKANADMSRELVGALMERRLRVAFQPVIDAATRQPAYHEALLRIIRTDGTVALASQVVPLIERLGLARLFDLAVLDQVLDTLAANTGAVLAVNVAPDTAAGPDWLARLVERLREMPDVGRRLIVEITETAAIKSIEETKRFVSQLHDLGVRLAIDDFGAGYTSFRNLRALSVDIIKIDGSFIENLACNPDDQIFVRHLAGLAEELGIETVAEWVRDEASAALLGGWGVRYFQGDVLGEATLSPDFAT